MVIPSGSINQQLITSDDIVMSNICLSIYNEILDEILLGVCFEIHRASKLGFLFIDESSPQEDQKYVIIDERGLDIFGQAHTQMKKQFECICPNCQRSLAASRFAPHLEKCMGMGRNSSRIASKRIASTGKSNDSDGEECDNSGDTDWNLAHDTRKPKKRKKLR
ncbi:ataxin-7-like protein 3 [Panonychus citri]|uniref:ataxin-7-like protein 3 n=1 Tax=Panonychus citri TaxID=50023 RepID=UPI002307BFBD|nr:ataxin-7-like protein 3 [Panonychus citri]